MTKRFNCWQCGKPLLDVILPMSRREECSYCHADQHVCKMCTDYEERKGCTEDRAESVSDREKANFCDYFAPAQKVHKASGPNKSDLAKAKLAALFGDPPPEIEETDSTLSPQQLAEKKLREMLG